MVGDDAMKAGTTRGTSAGLAGLLAGGTLAVLILGSALAPHGTPLPGPAVLSANPAQGSAAVSPANPSRSSSPSSSGEQATRPSGGAEPIEPVEIVMPHQQVLVLSEPPGALPLSPDGTSSSFQQPAEAQTPETTSLPSGADRRSEPAVTSPPESRGGTEATRTPPTTAPTTTGSTENGADGVPAGGDR